MLFSSESSISKKINFYLISIISENLPTRYNNISSTTRDFIIIFYVSLITVDSKYDFNLETLKKSLGKWIKSSFILADSFLK